MVYASACCRVHWLRCERSFVARRRDKQAILDSPDMLNDGIKARNTSDHVVNKDRWP